MKKALWGSSRHFGNAFNTSSHYYYIVIQLSILCFIITCAVVLIVLSAFFPFGAILRSAPPPHPRKGPQCCLVLLLCLFLWNNFPVGLWTTSSFPLHPPHHPQPQPSILFTNNLLFLSWWGLMRLFIVGRLLFKEETKIICFAYSLIKFLYEFPLPLLA